MADRSSPSTAGAASGPVDNAHFEMAMGMVMDRLDELKANQAQAIGEAIRGVLTDPRVVEQVMNTVASKAQERATQAAGRGALWFLRAVLTRWLVIGATVALCAKVVGWDVAARFGKWLTTLTT
jgi:hypothetical protein